MIVAVFGDAHAHADALEAVIAAAQAHGADELWSLGDMVGRGPDPEHVVARTRESAASRCSATTTTTRCAPPNRRGSCARSRSPGSGWTRTRSPGCARAGPPRSASRSSAGTPARATPCTSTSAPTNAAACLEKQRAPLGLIGHTHVAAAWHEHTRRVRITPGEPLDISDGKWLLNPGAVGAPASSRVGWWAGLDAQAAACWLLLDLDARTATWLSAPFDPAPAHGRVRELGLD